MHRTPIFAVLGNCMFRPLRPIILPILIALLLPLTASAASHEHAIQAKSAILMELGSGRILFDQNADQPIPPASLTKVMSMFVIFDAVKQGKVRLSDQVTISQTAAGTGGSRMNLKKSEQVSLDTILTGMAVSSGNDASMAAAEHVSGDVKSFVAAMNAKAASLGMRHTVFMNPTGLPAKGHISTARDMLTMARAYLKAYPDALEYHSQKTLVHNKVRTRNHNPLLESCPGADGLKSGWVCASGYNLITTAKRDGTRLVGVILGAATPGMRARENLRLMEAGFAAVKDHTTVAELLPSTPVPEYRRSRRGKKEPAMAAAESPKEQGGSKVSKKRVKVEYASAKMRVTRTTAAVATDEDDAPTPKAKTTKTSKRSKKSKVQSASTKSKSKAKSVQTSEVKRKRKTTASKSKSEPKTEAKAKSRSDDS